MEKLPNQNKKNINIIPAALTFLLSLPAMPIGALANNDQLSSSKIEQKVNQVIKLEIDTNNFVLNSFEIVNAFNSLNKLEKLNKEDFKLNTFKRDLISLTDIATEVNQEVFQTEYRGIQVTISKTQGYSLKVTFSQ